MNFKEKQTYGSNTNRLQVKTLLNTVDRSVQMQYVRRLALHGEFNLHRIKMAKPFNAYRSTRSNLQVDDKPVYTEWAKQVDFKKMVSDLRSWQEDNLVTEIVTDFNDYYRTTRPYHLSPFDPRVWIDQISQYGINEGKWYDTDRKHFNEVALKYVGQLNWTKERLSDTDPDHTDYTELLLDQPMFAILRTSATSAYPEYQRQTPEFILDNYAKAIRTEPSGLVTGYHRRHGFKRKFDETTGKSTIIEKDRFVGGVEFTSKVHGLPLTYSFFESKPEFSPYYKSWDTVFDGLLKKYKNASDLFGFTTDQSGFDQKHNSYLVKDTGELLLSTMPDHVGSHFRQVLYKDYNNPRIILNPFYTIRLGRWISVSGSPPTPLIETINNLAAHEYIIDKLGGELEYILCQIDDIVCYTSNRIDLEEFSKEMGQRFGFSINPVKTETTDRGFLIYLQNVIGKLLQSDLPCIDSSFSWEDAMGVIGYMPRRDHRLEFRERIFQTHGDIEFLQDDETGQQVDVDVDVSRMLGTISSFGPMLPIEYFEILVSHLENTDTWKRLVEYSKAKPIVKIGEFGWTPYPYLKFIASNY